MSYVTVYAERPSGLVEQYGHVNGAFGGALHIWIALLTDYGFVPATDGPARDMAIGRAMMGGTGPDSLMGKLWHDLPSIYAKNERDGWILGITFDKVLVKREHLAQLAEHLQSFQRDHSTNWNTLPGIASVLEKMSSDIEVVAAGFLHTSVAHDYWQVRAPTKRDPDRSRPYNTRRDAGHWYLTPESMREDTEPATAAGREG